MKQWVLLFPFGWLLVSGLSASAQPPETLNVSARGADIREVRRVGIAPKPQQVGQAVPRIKEEKRGGGALRLVELRNERGWTLVR